MLKLIRQHPQIRVAFSISGITIDQLEESAPEVLDSFRRLAETGNVDFLTETHFHSLACINPGNEFEFQVAKHQRKILKHFGVLSKVFRNTELIYSENTGERLQRLGFNGVMIDGIDRVLGDQTCHRLYKSRQAPELKLLLRDYRLSDDIAFRFGQGIPGLTAGQYIGWLNAIPPHENFVNLGMDYETFGEHQKKDSGIFAFLEDLFTGLVRAENFRFVTPSEAVEMLEATAELPIPGFISWADEERDLSAWLGNEMQRDAFDTLMKMETDIKDLHDKAMLNEWRTLQTSDHFYYMSTKKGSDGGVHHYFSPYPSPYEAFINYMNMLTDFALRVKIQKAAGVGSGVPVATGLSPAPLEVL